jgi:hypothetical protein
MIMPHPLLQSSPGRFNSIQIVESPLRRGCANDNNHKHDPMSDVKYVGQLLTQSERYSRFAFRKFEDNLSIMVVHTAGHIADLLMIDLRPYSPGRTGLMVYMVIREMIADDIIDFNEFVGIEMNRYQCTTQQLWNIITRSPERDKLIMYWIHATMGYLATLNNCGFVHCNLCMSNIVVDYNGNIKIINYGEGMLKGGCARAGRGHYKYSALETMQKPGTSIYDIVNYKENVDCFTVGVMVWELTTGEHDFPTPEATSSYVVADMSVLYYKRKCDILDRFSSS